MINVTADAGKFVVRGTRIKEVMASIPGAGWSSRQGAWLIPPTFNALVQLFAAAEGDVTFSDEVADFIADSKAYEDRLAGLKDGMSTAEDEHPVLYPQNARALKIVQEMIHQTGGALLSSGLGSGKMVVGAHAMMFPALLVTPAGTRRAWMEWLNRLYPDLHHAAVPTSPATVTKRRAAIAEFKESPAQGALLVTYAQLPLHSRLAGWGNAKLTDDDRTPKELNDIGFSFLLADEAHRAKSPKAKHTRALWYLNSKVDHRLIMTGTPTANIPEIDLWRMLQLAYPQGWSNVSRLRDRYLIQNINYWGGADIIGLNPATKEEHHRLRDINYLAVPTPVGDGIEFHTWGYTLSGKQLTQYTELEERSTLADEEVFAYNPLTKHTRMGEAALATVVKDGESTALTTPSTAMDNLIDLWETVDEPLLVFSASRKLVDLLNERLPKKVRRMTITGGMSTARIEESIMAYNRGDLDMLLCTTGAAADGWSGTGGRIVVFLLPDYKSANNAQAIGRLYGNGRGVEGKPTHVYTIIPENTVLAERWDNLVALEGRQKDASGPCK